MDSSGRRLLDLISYSASLGSTVDTCVVVSRTSCVKMDLGSCGLTGLISSGPCTRQVLLDIFLIFYVKVNPDPEVDYFVWHFHLVPSQGRALVVVSVRRDFSWLVSRTTNSWRRTSMPRSSSSLWQFFCGRA